MDLEQGACQSATDANFSIGLIARILLTGSAIADAANEPARALSAKAQHPGLMLAQRGIALNSSPWSLSISMAAATYAPRRIYSHASAASIAKRRATRTICTPLNIIDRSESL
ncbi:hypothetical protein CP97_05750 [Aurantiacibacter atlanticus]|uniref:Uncharacterized protein n=1 Tax=Aurantiacibacter atlanticus TaxID=1648404 RepID=A0A0H4VEV6_9SPHN|nr:hypothetical protein CP97_05750 [Aurantiacibacter atlanticus]